MLKPSVIISTYNSPDWLLKTLTGFECQSYPEIELVIADDGSGEDTRQAIDQFRQRSQLTIRHVWQPDQGFRKTRILNKAVLEARGNYLIFTDGDCIPRQDFVATHMRLATDGCFLSGGYFKLSESVSARVTEDDIRSGRLFKLTWLAGRGQQLPALKRLKLSARGRKAYWLNRLTPTRPSWNGHNASAFKDAILAVNGFDERMGYGGEDREFGERLIHAGIRPRQIRYSAICLHLEHERGYVTDSGRRMNDRIRSEVAAARRSRTDFGLNLHHE